MTEQAQVASGKGRKWLLWTTVAVIAVAGAGLAGYKFTLQNAIASQIEKRGGKAGSVVADFFGNIHLKDVVLPTKFGADVHIAAFDGRPQFLFLTGRANATGISTEVKGAKINIPSLTIDDANFNRQMLTEAFGGKSDLTPAQRVARFSAKQIKMPEIRVEYAQDEISLKGAYKDIVLTDIKNGLIAKFSSSASDFSFDLPMPDPEGGTKPENMILTTGLSQGEAIDAAFMARLYTEAAGPDDKAAKQVYGPFTAKNIVSRTKEGSVSYDEIKSGGYWLRMPTTPLLETVEMFLELADKKDPEAFDKLDETKQREFFQRFISLYEIFDRFDAELVNLKFVPTDPKLPNFNLASMKMALADRTFATSFKGLTAGTATDYVKIADFSWDGFSYASTLEAGKKLLALSAEEQATFPFSTLTPAIGTVSFSGIDVDVANPEYARQLAAIEEGNTGEAAVTTPAEDAEVTAPSDDTDGVAPSTPDQATPSDEATPATDEAVQAAEEAAQAAEEAAAAAEAGDAAADSVDAPRDVAGAETSDESNEVVVEAPSKPTTPERIKFTAKNFGLSAIKPINGIPTEIRFGYDDVTLAVPEIDEEAFNKLREAGFDKLTMSSNTHILWDEPTQSLLFKDISYKADKLGSVALSGTMGGMSKDFFSGDQVLMQVALIGLKAKELNLRIEDKGLIDTAFKVAAKEQGVTPDELRNTLVMGAGVLAQGFAADNEQVQEVVSTFVKFLAKPNIFTLSVTAKNSNGLGALEMAALSQDPMALLEKVNLKATAE